jgi:clan AA aspartic protease (TIGR02281 family)
MKRLLLYTFLLLTGTAFGWCLREMSVGPETPTPSVGHAAVATAPPIAAHTATPAGETAPAAAELSPTPSPARFEELLHAQAFEQAVAYYENALRIDDAYQDLWKPRLEAYLGAIHQRCTDGAFVELVDQWLNAYYDDIPVLLLLAENQRLCNSPEEAARTLQVASTYAIQPAARNRVNDAVAKLVASTDTSLSRQESWIALLGFFEFLQAIDLATRDSELRRAALYQLLGEHQRSRDVLQALREGDDGRDADWTAALDRQWRQSATASPIEDLPAQAIPLIRTGDHFLVSALINDDKPVLLMIDTGASVTTLSRNSFSNIGSAEFGYRGPRAFNTANGITQGEVYRARSIALGGTTLELPDIAVLEYESTGDIDGLLGMNVLRNYRFKIDQDNALLYLYPR